MDMQRLFVRRVFRGEYEIAVNSLELRFQHGSRQVEDNAPVPAVSQAEPRGACIAGGIAFHSECR